MKLIKNFARIAAAVAIVALAASCGKSSAPAASAVSTGNAITAEYLGTFVPESFITAFDATKSYAKAMTRADGATFHDVLDIQGNAIIAISRMHEETPVAADVMAKYKFATNGTEVSATDENGNKYIKISQNADYRYGMTSYLFGGFLGTIVLADSDDFLVTNNQIELGSNTYAIQLDTTMIPAEDDYMLTCVNDPAANPIAVKLENGNFAVYELTTADKVTYKNGKLIKSYKIE
jgi:hypothetical protein